MRRSLKKENSALSTRQGILLTLSIGLLMALMFVLVYYAYVLPLQKSIE